MVCRDLLNLASLYGIMHQQTILIFSPLVLCSLGRFWMGFSNAILYSILRAKCMCLPCNYRPMHFALQCIFTWKLQDYLNQTRLFFSSLFGDHPSKSGIVGVGAAVGTLLCGLCIKAISVAHLRTSHKSLITTTYCLDPDWSVQRWSTLLFVRLLGYILTYL